MNFTHFERKHVQTMRLVGTNVLMSENGNVKSQQEPGFCRQAPHVTIITPQHSSHVGIFK